VTGAQQEGDADQLLDAEVLVTGEVGEQVVARLGPLSRRSTRARVTPVRSAPVRFAWTR
jgi:hypothetical protein